MISVNVNVPFEIGDIVLYEHEEYDIDHVICPFCKGRGVIDFGIKEWNITHSKDKSGFEFIPMTRKCKNCENGKISFIKNIRIQKEEVVVHGISAYIPGGLSELSVMKQGGVLTSVPQHSLRPLKEEEKHDKIKLICV